MLSSGNTVGPGSKPHWILSLSQCSQQLFATHRMCALSVSAVFPTAWVAMGVARWQWVAKWQWVWEAGWLMEGQIGSGGGRGIRDEGRIWAFRLLQ